MTAKRTLVFLSALISFVAIAITGSAAAADKTYQVTGPVLEVNDTSITVQKGKEKCHLARTNDNKETGELKVGAKVTVTYTMTATAVEAKGGDSKAADEKPASAKASSKN